MKRAAIIVTVVTVGGLSMALAAQPSTTPAEQNPGTCLYNQPCLQNQTPYAGQGLQQWQSTNARQGRGQGMGRGVYRQQQQGYGQAFQNPGRQGFGRGNGQCLTNNASARRQGRARQGQGLGQGRQQRYRSQCNGGCGRRGRGCSW